MAEDVYTYNVNNGIFPAWIRNTEIDIQTLSIPKKAMPADVTTEGLFKHLAKKKAAEVTVTYVAMSMQGIDFLTMSLRELLNTVPLNMKAV